MRPPWGFAYEVAPSAARAHIRIAPPQLPYKAVVRASDAPLVGGVRHAWAVRWRARSAARWRRWPGALRPALPTLDYGALPVELGVDARRPFLRDARLVVPLDLHVATRTRPPRPPPSHPTLRRRAGCESAPCAAGPLARRTAAVACGRDGGPCGVGVAAGRPQRVRPPCPYWTGTISPLRSLAPARI